MRLYLLIAITVLPYNLYGQSISDDIKNGDLGYAQKQYNKAFTYYSSAANKGSEHAQLLIGEMIYRNKISRTDYKEALEWFNKSADKGNRDAMLYSALLYDLGYPGVPQDLKKALELYQRAAALGNITAINNLSSFYRTGKHGLLPRDHIKEQECYENSIKMGLDVGYTNLATFFADESKFTYDINKSVDILKEGIKKHKAGCASLLAEYYLAGKVKGVNINDAVQVLEEGISYGDDDARTTLGILYLRQNTGKELVNKGLELMNEAVRQESSDALFFLGKAYCGIFNESIKDIPRGIEYLKASFSKGNNKAGIFLSLVYDKGLLGLAEDHELANKFFEEAISLMPSDFLTTLGTSYLTGGEEGIDIDNNKARKLFEKAIALNNTKAMYDLANMYCDANGVKKSYPRAIELYRQAIQAGGESGMYGLGLLYAHGEGFDKPDYQKAAELYQKAANAGNINAAYNLALFYEYGNDKISKDLSKAKDLYEKAANWGDAEAMNKLGMLLIQDPRNDQDKSKAKIYLQKACSLNLEDACSNCHELVK